MKYPLVIKFPKHRWPIIEKRIVNSTQFRLPLMAPRKRIGIAYFYLVIYDKSDSNDKYTASVTHVIPDENLHTYLQDNKFPFNNLAGLFSISPNMPKD